VGRLFDRSGIAVGQICTLLGWRPDVVYHIGIGRWYNEVKILSEEWPGVKFIGVEPLPFLWEKTKKEGYPGPLHQVAISNFDGKATLYSKDAHKDGSSLFPHKSRKDKDRYREVEVEVRTLDSLFGQLNGQQTLLWLDIEGSELQGLQGGEKFIRGVQVINLEMTANPDGIGWSSPYEVNKWLMEHGFKKQWTHTNRTSMGQYDAIYVRPHLFKPEYCCCPCQCKPKGTSLCDESST
jgi:FkbM family methyltransferase